MAVDIEWDNPLTAKLAVGINFSQFAPYVEKFGTSAIVPFKATGRYGNVRLAAGNGGGNSNYCLSKASAPFVTGAAYLTELAIADFQTGGNAPIWASSFGPGKTFSRGVGLDLGITLGPLSDLGDGTFRSSQTVSNGIHTVGYRLTGGTSTSSCQFLVDGTIADAATGPSGNALGYPAAGMRWRYLSVGADTNINLGGSIAYHFVWYRALPNEEWLSVEKDPWQLFRKKQKKYFFFPSAGGGAITGSGTPAAQSATVAGTATRTITGSGAPSAQAATAAGTAEREITGSGAPVSQDATVAGTGSVSAGVSGSGSLSAQSATVAGTATRTVTASGTPSAQSATVAGTAEREVTGSGTPTAQSATVVGTGQIGNIVTGSGAPAAQSATVAGTAEREITSSGAVSAQSATVAGTGVRVITGTGSPNAQDATVYGYDVAPQTAHNTGGGGSRKMLLSERKVRDEVDEWLKKKREQEMLARIQREDEELVLILALVA